MSPEQARGKPVDKRADIWAFGAVLYEILTGQRPFKGRDVSEVLGSVLRLDPDWDALPDDTPPHLNVFLKRCLEKEPRQRVHDIADVRLAMEGAFQPVIDATAVPDARVQLRIWQRPVATFSIVLIAIAITGLTVWTLARSNAVPAGRVTRFPIVLPAGDAIRTGVGRSVALSPDGTHLVYAANRHLYLRPMNQQEAVPIRGTELDSSFQSTASGPFFSPGGESVGFWVQGKLKKVSVGGGVPVTLAEAFDYSRGGASWGADDTILFSLAAAGIWRVPATGGEAEVLIELAEGEQAQSPQMLPGDWVLFTLLPSGVDDWNDAQIVTQSVNTGERRVLIGRGKEGQYVATGHLVYALEGTLLAVPFDVERLTVAPGPVPLVEDVAEARSLQSGTAHFSLSKAGTLVYLLAAERRSLEDLRTLVWVDRAGGQEPLPQEPRGYQEVRLSPDGTRLAVAISGENENRDVWVYDIGRDAFTRFTFDLASERNPVWTPDSERLAFSRRGTGLLWRAADGIGQADLLLEESGTQNIPWSFSPDGATLVTGHGPDFSQDIGALSLEGERTVRSLGG